MRGLIKGGEPPKLAQFREQNPQANWDDFRGGRVRRNQVKQVLLAEQQGLCCYCEIDLKASQQNDEVDDFRVEHFHPKSDSTSEHNWGLDWQNLLACCSGGNVSNVVDAVSRATAPDHSCDVPKQDNIWDDVILNPLELPANVSPFSFSRGEPSITVNTAICEQFEIDQIKAAATIEKLKLNAPRLKRLRDEKLTRLNDLLNEWLASGIEFEQAISEAREIFLAPDANNHLPAFYSAMADYL